MIKNKILFEFYFTYHLNLSIYNLIKMISIIRMVCTQC